MLSTHHPKIKHWLIVIKKHIIINKPIEMLLIHRFLSYKYVKCLLMHNTDNFCFGVIIEYKLQKEA